METFEKVDFSLENPETSAFYYTEKGYLKYDMFTRSFYDNEGSSCNIKYFFREVKTFEQVSNIVIKHLCEKYHPHCMLVATTTNAQIFEGVKSTGEVLDYIKE